MKRVCVFCGSSSGSDPAFLETARALGRELAKGGHGLVYGGAHVGLMGALADEMLSLGADVLGVIPHGLAKREVAHTSLTELRVVGSMHERKALMADLADGFIAMPGGFGTLDEFFEILTWAQLGIHTKPCGMLNVSGFYDRLLEFLDSAVTTGLLKQQHRELFLVDTGPAALIARMKAHRPTYASKWAEPTPIP